MDNINYGAYFEAILMEETHIQSKTFKVTIPAIFPVYDKKDQGQETIKNSLEENNGFLNSKLHKMDAEYESTTIITALNHTDYHFQLKGDVFTMKGSKGNTMMNLKDQGGVLLAYGPNTPHFHKWEDPHQMYNFIFENLNNVKLPAGTKCYGFFINGIRDINKFAVTRIEGAVPLDKGSAPKYVK